jgi:hypothetical protein
MRRVPEEYNCLCDCARVRRRCSGIRSRIVQVVLVAPSLVAPSPVAPSVVARSLVSPSSYARYSLGSLRQHIFPSSPPLPPTVQFSERSFLFLVRAHGTDLLLGVRGTSGRCHYCSTVTTGAGLVVYCAKISTT